MGTPNVAPKSIERRNAGPGRSSPYARAQDDGIDAVIFIESAIAALVAQKAAVIENNGRISGRRAA